MSLQEIYESVGEKLREIFKAADLDIRIYDERTDLLHMVVAYTLGRRRKPHSVPLEGRGFSAHVLRTRKPLVINEKAAEAARRYRSRLTSPDALHPKSSVYVPLVAGDRALGLIALNDMKREHAFSDSHVRLLQTLASSMSVALENARLFDETQRLYRAEQQRAAELAVINSIQQGMASKLDFQTIVDLVGDKLREVFNTPDLGIVWYNEKTKRLHYLYVYEHGKRLVIEPRPPVSGGSFEAMTRTREPQVLRTAADYERTGQGAIPGTDQSKSLISVPIISSDRVLGMIGIENYERENAYGESDLRLLTTIAASLGTALENARLFDETQRLFKAEQQRVAELAIINSIQQGLASELDFQAIVDLVGDKLREVFATPDLGINWYDEKTNLVHYLYVYEHGKRLTIAPRPPRPGGNFETMARTKQPQVLNSVAEMAQANALAIPGTDHSKSTIVVPIISGDRVLGSIGLENYEREYAYGESELRLLMTIAASLGTALENARLFDETQRLLKETEQRNAELAIINSVQEGLASKLEMQAIYDLVGNKVRQIFDADVVGFSVYESEANLVRYVFLLDHGERFHPEPGPPAGFTAHILRTRQPIVIHTVDELNRRMEELGSRQLGGATVDNSFIYVPILRSETASGVICVGKQRPHAFTNSDVTLLTTLGNAMSVALENARLFDETQHLLSVTEQRAAELAVINSIQQGMASKLDFQAIVDLVGDKLREVFHSGDIGIRWHDPKANLIHYLYQYEHGVRLTQPPTPPAPGGAWSRIVQTRQPFVVRSPTEFEALGLPGPMPGTDQSLSMVSVPIIGSDRVLGTIALENYEREDAFGEAEVRLLTTVAASMGVALENARLFDETQRLFRAEQQRAAELAVINSIQQGMASKLDFQAIVDLVGDKLREVFQTGDMGIRWYDPKANLNHFLYEYAHGQRANLTPRTPSPGALRLLQTRQPAVVNNPAEAAALGFGVVPGTDQSLSSIAVPILGSDRALGSIVLENYERENAFGEAEIRLLTTVAASMGVALENARLFDETQRLFKAEQQRAAELAVINSIQQGLVAQLDLMAIIDLVGDKLREVFDTGNVSIVWFDQATYTVTPVYYYEQGRRLTDVPPQKLKRTERNLRVVEKRETVAQRAMPEGATAYPGTTLPKSDVRAPVVAAGRVIAIVNLDNYEREGAFGDDEVRLLTTVCTAMGMALQSPRASSTRRSACSRKPSSATPSWRSSTACRRRSRRSSTSRASTTQSATRSVRSSTTATWAFVSTIPRPTGFITPTATKTDSA
ncbi:MAG TPA: GAF domain-containing protein [Casimicrobiaceae bacterium]|nr:GAF domain-containing protein [Casimicrobiaceae bacterium]